MYPFKKLVSIRQEIVKRIPQEITVFVSQSINTLKLEESELYCYYRFLLSEEGSVREIPLKAKDFPNTKALYNQIIEDFFTDKQLVSCKEEIKRFSADSIWYLGICLRNRQGMQLNLYYSSQTLFAYEEMKQKVEEKKASDFYQYGIIPIQGRMVKRMVFYPTENDLSSVYYIRDNEEYDNYHLRIQKQFSYYYQKSGNKIETADLKGICYLIRLFINSHLEFHPRYFYPTNYSNLTSEEMAKVTFPLETKGLNILCDNGAFIEISDLDLIDAIEKSRILDDLWLLRHGLIDTLPTQEESLEKKEWLRELNRIYRANQDVK